MLDLDSLIEQRATVLNQTLENWHSAVWSAEFQKISASMSDGEVEQLIALCPSGEHLNAVIAFLSTCDGQPFDALKSAAANQGQSLADWIQTRSKA